MALSDMFNIQPPHAWKGGWNPEPVEYPKHTLAVASMYAEKQTEA